MKPFTVGSDAEFFLSHYDAGWIPATGFNCPGTKLEPTPVEGKGTYHRDNVSVEIQPPPAETPKEFERNCNNLFNHVDTIYQGMSMRLMSQAVVQFDRSKLDAVEEASEIGCEPDKCAYEGETKTPTDAETMGTYRTGSGHIHIGGIEDLDESQRREVVKWLDVLEGLYGKYYESRYEATAYIRRQFYGQAGRYRMKDYGLEWRTPSNTMWANWALGGYSRRLFSSIFVATTLIRSGVTLSSLYSERAIARARESIDDDGTKAVIRRLYYWQDALYEHDVIKTVIKQGEKIYGARAGLYSV